MESANSTVGKMENSSASEEVKISEKKTSKSGNQLLQLKMKIIQLLDQKAYHSLTFLHPEQFINIQCCKI